MKKLLITFLLLTASQAQAQAWSNPKIADYLSYGTVGASIGLDVFKDFKATDKKHAFLISGERILSKIITAEITKLLVHEERPDKSDNKSFFSEHTELSTAFSDNKYVDIILTGTTGYLRVAANKHHWWDSATGAGVGFAFNIVFKK